jgi:hypothetical protein
LPAAHTLAEISMDRRDFDPLDRHAHHLAGLFHLHRAVLPQVPQHRPLSVHLPLQQRRPYIRVENGQDAPLLRPVHQEIDHRHMLRIDPLRPPRLPRIRIKARHEPGELVSIQLPLHQLSVSTHPPPRHRRLTVLRQVLISPRMTTRRQVAHHASGPRRPHDTHPSHRHQAMVHCVRFEREGEAHRRLADWGPMDGG